jgi:Spy/CpxP family protein refolding chaperone
MKNRTLTAGVVVAVALAVAAPIAFAQHRMHQRAAGFGGPMMLEHLDRAKQALGLSDDQVTQIKSIFADVRTQNAPYREQLRGGIHSVVQSLLANPNDTAAAQAIIDQQAAAEKALKTNLLNATSKALNVLTADQRAKLASFVQERMARRANR